MFEKFNLKKIEILFIVIAIFAAGALSGYFISKGVGPKTININVSDEVRENTDAAIADTGIENETEADAEKIDYIAKVNINTANIKTLRTLTGIGEVIAQRIIDYRTQNGKFSRVEDILEVEGIGAGRYEAIRDYIFV